MQDVIQRTMYFAKPEHTSTSKRIPVSSGMLEDSVWTKINGLDFHDYLEY